MEPDLLVDFLFSCFVVRLFGCQKLFCQHDIFQGSVLWKEVEGLEYQSEMQPFFTHGGFLPGGRVGRVKKDIAAYPYDSPVRTFQKI